MATIIFDQENNDVAPTLLSKDRLKLSHTTKPIHRGQQVKVFGSVQNTSRKVLGNINKQAINQKSVLSQKAEFKVKKPVPVAKKVPEACLKQSYPEIDKFVPYNPKDFESFEVPEEHKLSHVCLAGVPLMVNDTRRLDALLNQELAPMEIPSFSWNLDTADDLQSFVAILDEITLDMPPMLFC